jgi:hypothetical protein
MVRRLALALLAASAVLPAAAQQPDIRPGLWEFTMSGVGAMSQKVCLSPAMVKDMKQMAARGDPNSDCKATNEKVSGATRSFDLECTKPNVMRGKVTVTVDGPDRFSMTQDFVAERAGKSQSGKFAITYRRVGDCPK